MSSNSNHRTSESIPQNRPIARRKRKPLSCSLCRRRKLACDREYPSCGRCQKTGNIAFCSYEDGHPRSSDNRSEPRALGQNRSVLNPTLVLGDTTLSAPLAGYRDNGDSDRPFPQITAHNGGTWQLLNDDSVSNTANGGQRPAIKADVNELTRPHEPRPAEAVIFRGDNYMTQYYGSTNPTSLIAHFPELRSYMKETIKHHPSLPGVQKELKALDTKWKYEKSSVPSVKEADLLRLLPDHTYMDAAVQLYFDTFETVYRIVHRPSFLEEYDQLRSDRGDAKPGFIILVLLVMATVCCTTTTDRAYVGSSSLGRERGTLWIETAEAWLEKQSKKNIYLLIWQIRCLLVLAKQMCRYKKKRMWSVAGDLVREGMVAGFHRDPSRLGSKISFFDQEIRRRLWATMVELELQASIERGMPSTLAATRMDCAPPLDVDDEDLRPESEAPRGRRASGYRTTTLFLRSSRNSLDLRVSLNSRVNDLTLDMTHEETLRYDDMIMSELQRLPQPVEGNHDTRAIGLSQMARTVLDLQLRQFLVLLHAPFARKAEANSRYALSRMICFNAAASMIDQHWRLSRAGNSILLLLRHDYFRGAFNLSHYAYVSGTRPDPFVPIDHNTILQYIQHALFMLEDSITYIGTGFTYHWYISAGISFLRSLSQSAESSTFKQEAINQVVKQYYRVLASQETFIQARAKIYSPQLSKETDSSTKYQFTSHNVAESVEASLSDAGFPQFDPTDEPLEEYFFGDPAAWTFDNLWEIQ
ncbi:uncharacterized protein BDW43DRAFT_267187 [Aspergillus alliaceus]|uniref:uncharacterized protein n=1 Tax=Petromyces alliaceus TaxID=209559 RepID=UPI0012A489B6|nr:uncharacterized protein BDW43DRAFT_267187 [Aspergillus alliaceus]KAB8236559.1 hypothetical protein BDW43DRAFT_267187 [Aspergillus alliaceus]